MQVRRRSAQRARCYFPLPPLSGGSLYLFLQLQLGRRQPGSSAVGTMNWNAKDYNEISLNCIWSEHVRAAPFVALQCTPSRRLLFAATVRPFGTPGLSSRVRVLRPASGGEGGEADSKGYQDDVHVQSVLVARAEQRPRQPPYAAQRPNAAQGAAIPGARRQRRTRPRRAPAAACLLLLLQENKRSRFPHPRINRLFWNAQALQVGRG